MNFEEAKNTIELHALSEQGAMWKIRENNIDENGFAQLLAAIDAYKLHTKGNAQINRAVVASLFEIPWEIENTRSHYLEVRGEEAARLLDSIAEQLREAISNLLWDAETV